MIIPIENIFDFYKSNYNYKSKLNSILFNYNNYISFWFKNNIKYFLIQKLIFLIEFIILFKIVFISKLLNF